MNLTESAERFVQEQLSGEITGHDTHHISRVRKLALYIGKHEGLDLELVDLIALLHDIGDHKLTGSYETGPQMVREFLTKTSAPANIVETVSSEVGRISFSKGNVPETPEGKCVQDADRLDVFGPIGVARVFSHAHNLGNPIYDPENANNGLQHFKDKLLKLKDLMNTQTGKNLAETGHTYMQKFYDEFLQQWDDPIAFLSQPK